MQRCLVCFGYASFLPVFIPFFNAFGDVYSECLLPIVRVVTCRMSLKLAFLLHVTANTLPTPHVKSAVSFPFLFID